MTAFPLWAWVGFTALIAVLLALDLLVLARGAREISFRRAALLSVFWVGVAMLFGVLVLVGAKFIYSGLFGKVPVYVSLPFIAAAVTVSILASLYKTRGESRKPAKKPQQRSEV